MNTNPLLHTLIIWSEALSIEQLIIEDIQRSFNLLDVYSFNWEKELFNENLKRFYAHSQKEKSQEEFNDIISNKIAHCGDGEFTVLVFEDINPYFSTRKTSNGENSVNTNVFDKKKKFRELVGGGHKIHASDNYFETNKDLVLLFGRTCEEYLKNVSGFKDSKKIQKSNNILGVPFWKNIEELFFVLDHSINYVVLRNFECLPNDYHQEGHGDIDLLVEDFNYVKYLTGGTPIYPELDYRVYHHININEELVPFDFRFVGDNYYDPQWELDIINYKIPNEGGFYQPTWENYFYSLLYHAYVQKRNVSADYKVRLETLAKKIEVNYYRGIKDEECLTILDDFMEQKGYQYTLPNDFTVFYNKGFLSQNKEIEDFGKLVRSTHARADDKIYSCDIYCKDGKYVKVGSNPICLNENNFLSMLSESKFFPNILDFEEGKNRSRVDLEEIIGVEPDNIYNVQQFWTIANIYSFILDCISILIELLENNIEHRDITPGNIILRQTGDTFRATLIDFGWAKDKDDNGAVTCYRLGSGYKWKGEGYSDAYSMGMCMERVLGGLGELSSYHARLKKITPEDYQNKTKLLANLKDLQKLCLKNKSKLVSLAKFQILKYRLKVLLKNSILGKMVFRHKA